MVGLAVNVAAFLFLALVALIVLALLFRGASAARQEFRTIFSNMHYNISTATGPRKVVLIGLLSLCGSILLGIAWMLRS